MILNKSILLKGGTLILIDKKLPVEISRSYLHPTSRISTCNLKIFDIPLYLINVYAPSGKNKEQERENLFETDLMYQLIQNTDNMIMGGDWNSILSKNDSSKPSSSCYSKAFKSLINTLKYKDIFLSNKQKPKYTFYKNNYAARLDRIYLNSLLQNINDTITYPVSFSDHLCVCVSLQVSTQIQISRPRWRLNVSLLKNELVQENFNRQWINILGKKSSFPNIIQWWDGMAKPEIKKFYIIQGKEQKRMKDGLMKYYENKLNKLYETANNDNIFEYEAISDIKQLIDSLKQKDVEAIRIRSKDQDDIGREKVSKYLIAKQKSNPKKKK